MQYNISVQKFEGPLDLLLHLIESAEIDIMDIFVSEITSQYIEYVNGMDMVDMDTASEFLTMAARLLYIKSRSLLPKPPKEQDLEEEEDPEQVLIRQLREYKAFKEASEVMKEQLCDAQKSRTKLPEEFILPTQETLFTGGTSDEIFKAFERILKRIDESDYEKKKATHEVSADLYTVRNCMKDVREALAEKDTLRFEELFDGMHVKMRVIVTFMALLEMIMRGEVIIKQSAPYEPIWISKNELSENDDAASYMDEELS